MARDLRASVEKRLDHLVGSFLQGFEATRALHKPAFWYCTCSFGQHPDLSLLNSLYRGGCFCITTDAIVSALQTLISGSSLLLGATCSSPSLCLSSHACVQLLRSVSSCIIGCMREHSACEVFRYAWQGSAQVGGPMALHLLQNMARTCSLLGWSELVCCLHLLQHFCMMLMCLLMFCHDRI